MREDRVQAQPLRAQHALDVTQGRIRAQHELQAALPPDLPYALRANHILDGGHLRDDVVQQLVVEHVVVVRVDQGVAHHGIPFVQRAVSELAERVAIHGLREAHVVRVQPLGDPLRGTPFHHAVDLGVAQHQPVEIQQHSPTDPPHWARVPFKGDDAHRSSYPICTPSRALLSKSLSRETRRKKKHPSI